MKGKIGAVLLAAIVAITGCGQTGGTVNSTSSENSTSTEVAASSVSGSAEQGSASEQAASQQTANEQTAAGTENQEAQADAVVTAVSESNQSSANTVEVTVDGQSVVKTVGETSGTAAASISNKYSNRDKDASWSLTGATQISFSGSSAQISGNGAKLTGNQLILSEEGTYVLSGSWSDGQIVVEAADTAKVQIVFNGADITSKTGSVLHIKTADKVFLTLAEGTTNKLTDAASYADTSTDAADAAIYSKTDLTINGSGALTVNALYKDGIKSKDELTITGGKLTVSAKDDAITGKDSVAIWDGSFAITAGKDGIKASNTTDAAKGWISIDGGSFKITAGGDGIQGETVVEINGGSFEVVSGGGSTSAAANMQANQLGQMPMQGQKPSKGQKPQKNQMGQAPLLGQMPQGQTTQDSAQQSQTTAQATDTAVDSSKGIKAGTELLINGGDMNVNAADDALHSNGSITVKSGVLKLASGDDGIHAETELNITEQAKIDVTVSLEGLEAKAINVSGGTTNVNANDDGVNATAGSTGGFGGGMEQAQQGVVINITGGFLMVNAQGDGLDSNGNISVSGGTTIVYGPTNDGNGSLDYNGSASISAGSFVALGSRGMFQGFNRSSGQASLAFSYSGSAGEQLTLADSSGKVIASFTAAKSFQTVLISTASLKAGVSYTLYKGGTLSEPTNGLTTGGTIKNGTAVTTLSL